MDFGENWGRVRTPALKGVAIHLIWQGRLRLTPSDNVVLVRDGRGSRQGMAGFLARWNGGHGSIPGEDFDPDVVDLDAHTDERVHEIRSEGRRASQVVRRPDD